MEYRSLILHVGIEAASGLPVIMTATVSNCNTLVPSCATGFVLVPVEACGIPRRKLFTVEGAQGAELQRGNS